MGIYDADDIRLDAVDRAKERPRSGGSGSVHASLQNPKARSTRGKQRKTNVVAKPPPTGYYAIVGRGLAATVNLSTLLQTPWGIDRLNSGRTDRLGAPIPLPVLFVGFADPWSGYENHEMGQIANLLHMPGFEQRPLHTLTGPRQSRAFAQQTRAEIARLREHRPFGALDAAVLLVQPRGTVLGARQKKELKDGESVTDEMLASLEAPWPTKYPPYRLLVIFSDGVPGLVYAHKVDVCTGAGRPRQPPVEIVGPALRDECRGRLWRGAPVWGDPERRRKVVTGTDGLVSATEWNGNTRVCVNGGGGVAVNMIERARETASILVDWVYGKTLHASFANPRNDPLLWNSTQGRAMQINESTARTDATTVLRPASTAWRFGQWVAAAKVDDDPRGVLVEFAASTLGASTNILKASSAVIRAAAALAAADRRIAQLETELAALEETARTSKNSVQRAAIRDIGIPNKRRALQAERDARPALEKTLTDNRKALTEAEKVGRETGDARLYPQVGDPVGLEGEAFPLGPGHDPYSSAPRLYDRIIFCLGQDPAGAGQPQHMLSLLTLASLRGMGGRMVGLATADAAVRVLGIASTVNAPWVKDEPGYNELKAYERTVPLQAIPDGFTLNSLKVAVANHYFDTHANDNVNTMTREELTGRYGADLATGIIHARRIHPNGIADLGELRTLLAMLRLASAQTLATVLEADFKTAVDPGDASPRDSDDLFKHVVALRKTPPALVTFGAECSRIPAVLPPLAPLRVGYRADDPLLPIR